MMAKKGRSTVLASALALLCQMTQHALGAEAPASMMLTLRANIWAQQLGALMNKGVSSSDPDIKLPGSPAYDKYHAALVRADSKSAQIANQRNLPAVTIGYTAQLICSGVYVQNLGPLVPPAVIGCEVPADCALQVLPDPAAVGIPPANLSPGTVLMTLLANCTCPFPLPQASGKPETTPYYARADSFSPQDQFSGIPTPVIAWNPKYGCQVLQHVTIPIQQDPVYPAFTDDGVPPVIFDWPVVTAGSSGAFSNVDHNLIKTQMAQFFPNTAPAGVAPGITDSNTYAIGVFYKGKLIAEQYAPGITPSTKLLSNSIIKSFFINYMAGLRSVDGKMSIDDPVGAPHWGAQVIKERGIKVDNLLRTNAGLQPEGGTIPEQDYYDDSIMLTDQPDVPAYAAGLPLAYCPPGAVWDYSNAGFAMAALAIRNSFNGETASYWSYPFNKLYKRVGCANVTLGTDSVGNLLQTATGMFATLYDYAKLGSIFLYGGKFQGQQILPKEWVEYSLTPVPNSATPGGGQYGAGWWLGGYPTVKQYSYNAFGAFGQRVFIVPEKELMILHFGLASGAVRDGYVWNTQVGTYLFGNITNAIT